MNRQTQPRSPGSCPALATALGQEPDTLEIIAGSSGQPKELPVRILLAAAGLAALLIAPAPAFAGPSETALLASFAGTWTGKGEITGPDAGKINCRMTMKATRAGKLTYNGRCSVGTGAASFTGTMQYNDSARRYEATSSSRGQSATAIGKPQSSGVVFTTTTTDERIGKVSSTIALSGAAITLSFKTSATAGENTSSSITLTKS